MILSNRSSTGIITNISHSSSHKILPLSSVPLQHLASWRLTIYSQLSMHSGAHRGRWIRVHQYSRRDISLWITHQTPQHSHPTWLRVSERRYRLQGQAWWVLTSSSSRLPSIRDTPTSWVRVGQGDRLEDHSVQQPTLWLYRLTMLWTRTIFELGFFDVQTKRILVPTMNIVKFTILLNY